MQWWKLIEFAIGLRLVSWFQSQWPCMSNTGLFCLPHDFISHQERLKAEHRVCLADSVELLQLCLFLQFFLIFLLLPQASMLQSRMVFIWLCLFQMMSLHRTFYFENWQDALCWSCLWLPAWINLLSNASCGFKNRLGLYSPWSRAEGCFRDAFKMRFGMDDWSVSIAMATALERNTTMSSGI